MRQLSNSSGILENSSFTIQTPENGSRGNKNFGIRPEVTIANPEPVSLSTVALYSRSFYKFYFRRLCWNGAGKGWAEGKVKVHVQWLYRLH